MCTFPTITPLCLIALPSVLIVLCFTLFHRLINVKKGKWMEKIKGNLQETKYPRDGLLLQVASQVNYSLKDYLFYQGKIKTKTQLLLLTILLFHRFCQNSYKKMWQQSGAQDWSLVTISQIHSALCFGIACFWHENLKLIQNNTSCGMVSPEMKWSQCRLRFVLSVLDNHRNRWQGSKNVPPTSSQCCVVFFFF